MFVVRVFPAALPATRGVRFTLIFVCRKFLYLLVISQLLCYDVCVILKFSGKVKYRKKFEVVALCSS